MRENTPARREFLLQAGGATAAALLASHWPAIVAAAQHAHESAKSSKATFDVLTPEQARQVEAIAAVIIPSDDLPGAREAGVVFFIDRALKTFASEERPTYEKGIADLQKLTVETFPGVKTFADASHDQKEKLIAVLAPSLEHAEGRQRRSLQRASADFLPTIWQHTVLGFLADPVAGGNKDYAGWKVIGRDPSHSFSPPFGFYDKDYPGWQPASADAEKR